MNPAAGSMQNDVVFNSHHTPTDYADFLASPSALHERIQGLNTTFVRKSGFNAITGRVKPVARSSLSPAGDRRRMTGIHVSLCQAKSTDFLGRSGERAQRRLQNVQLAYLPLGRCSCSRRTGHPFAVSGSKEPSQKIEFVFPASPEPNRREPLEMSPSLILSCAGPGSLRAE
jgi:hypothetical protein